MIYLIEKGRIDAAALTRLMAALNAADAVLVEVPFDRHVAQAMTRVARTDVPDLPDRIIVGTEGCSRSFMLGLLDVLEPESLAREMESRGHDC